MNIENEQLASMYAHGIMNKNDDDRLEQFLYQDLNIQKPFPI